MIKKPNLFLMQNLLPFFFLILSFSGTAQTIDAIAVEAEVDSLIDLTQQLAQAGKFEQALMTVDKAQEKCIQAFGKQSALYAKCLHYHGVVYYFQQKLTEVEPLWVQCMEVRKEVFGNQDTLYIGSVINLGILYMIMNDIVKAEPLLIQGKDFFERIAKNKEHPFYIICLNNLGNAYARLGEFEKAIVQFELARDIRAATVGTTHPDYATTLRDLGNLYVDSGNYEKAEALYLEAKGVWGDSKEGNVPRNRAIIRLELGNLYLKRKNYQKAELYYQETLPLAKNYFGKKHPFYLDLIDQLGLVYSKLGENSEAVSFYLEACQIQETTLGTDHPEYARSLFNLGRGYAHMDNFDKAEVLLLQALETQEKNFGRVHLEVALTMLHLAMVYMDLGNYEKGEALLLEAKEITGKSSDLESEIYANILTNLGNLYFEKKDEEKAEENYLEAKLIMEQLFGVESPAYADCLNNLANLYDDFLEQPELAEKYYLEAKEIYQKSFGKAHPDYLLVITNLAYTYYKMGAYEKAEHLYLESKKTRARVLGKSHYDYTFSLNNLAKLYWKTGQYDKVAPLQFELYENQQKRIEQSFSFLSEDEKEKLIRVRIQPNIDRIFSSGVHIHSSEFQNMLYDVALMTKAIRLQSSKSTFEFLLQQQDLGALLIYQNLLAVRQKLTEQYQQPVATQINLDSLENEEENLEKQLARRSATFRNNQVFADITIQEVKASLRPGEAALEFVRFERMDPGYPDSVLFYAAVLLKANSPHAHFVPLFEEKQLAFLLGNTEDLGHGYVNNLYQISHRGLKPNKERAPSLYELIWQPLDSLLQDVEKIYYSPSGLLHRLNLRAISVDPETTINDLYQLRTLASTRLLALPDEDTAPYENQALVYGDVQYDYDTSRIKKALEVLDSTTIASTHQAYRGGSWNYLYWTKEESTKIQALLQAHHINTTLHSQYDATEESFKRLGSQTASPRVLHLATHGFFFPEPSEEEEQGPVFTSSDHPMVRSGLVLTGGNRVWGGEDPFPGQEDGILTALEISQMNLTNTELVVLSACETGLGDIVGSEGVFGLQRAFKMAGVKYLIMSLWQVPDRETKDLMISFYQKWLQEDMSIPDAFQSAQKELAEKFYDPYNWAGFILLE